MSTPDRPARDLRRCPHNLRVCRSCLPAHYKVMRGAKCQFVVRTVTRRMSERRLRTE